MIEPGLEKYQDRMVIMAFIFLTIALALVVLVALATLFVKFSRALCLRKLEYRRYFQRNRVIEGEETELVEEFTNHSFLPMFVVDVETHISSCIKMKGCQSDDEITQKFLSRFFIMPYTRIRRVHKAVCKKRGYYRLESAKITFAKVEVYLDSQAELYVYPVELPFPEQSRIREQLQYSAVSRRPLMEDPFSFAGIRKYVQGDPMHFINYKQSARRGEWMVNAREYMLGRRLLIYLNFQPNEKLHISQEQFGKYLEKELSAAAYLLWECVRNGYSYLFRMNSKMPSGESCVRTPMLSGEMKYEEILDEMAQTGYRYGVSMASMIDRDLRDGVSGMEMFLFTTYVDESLMERAVALEQAGNAVNLINLLEWQEWKYEKEEKTDDEIFFGSSFSDSGRYSGKTVYRNGEK